MDEIAIYRTLPAAPDPNGLAELQCGVDAITSEDKSIKARTFIAPFSYIDVWVLEPKTLAVLDKQQGFDSQKLAEPIYKAPLDLGKSEDRKYVARRITGLIESSVGEALAHSKLSTRRGKVEAGDLRVVNPGEAQKDEPR